MVRSEQDYSIEFLPLPVNDTDLRALALLLVDAVESGAAVSFLPPLALERAEAWWRAALTAPSAGTVFLVARDVQGIAGSVQLHPAWAPNQPHRADIAKLLVHRRCRRKGVGSALMRAVEKTARQAGLRLLVLDTRRGDGAESLYRQLGWCEAGIIPGYALNADGSTHDTVYFYKDLSAEA